MATRIQVRRDTAANWRTSGSTVLEAGEIGFESDTLLFKIGDGSATWTNLEYAGGTEPIQYNPSGTSITDLDAIALRNNGNSKYLIAGADTVGNDPAGLSTATDGQLLVTVSKYDYTGTSATNERYLMTLQTLTTGKFFFRTYNGSWSSWQLMITATPTGDATVPGDLAVNGGDITTTSTGTATVFNTNATTLNVGQAATTVSIGATTGTATIRNATTAITGNATVGGSATVGTTLDVTGNTTLTGDLAVNGGDITTSAATATVFDTAATTVDIAGAATTLNIADAATTAQTINIGTGATGSGQTKTINIGTGGAAGSTTNVNLGDNDGGLVTVNRALTVNGLTTLLGGLSGNVSVSSFPSGTIVKTHIVQFNEDIQTQIFGGSGSATRTATNNFSYTPARSGSTISIIIVGGYASTSHSGTATSASGSISFTASAGGGSISISNFGAALSFSTLATSRFLYTGALISHTASSSAARTYTLTVQTTVNGPTGGSTSTITSRIENITFLLIERVP